MNLVLTPQTLPDAESYNVIGDMKGSEHPEQVVIVSGHLDSWDLGTGAIDDGAGVAVSMEAANLVRKLGLIPKRTIRVVAWMNEENGARGSKQYAKEHAKELPIILRPLKPTVARIIRSGSTLIGSGGEADASSRSRRPARFGAGL